MIYERAIDLLKRFIFTKNITARKFINFCLVTFQHIVLRNSYVVGYPIELVIDPCNICILNCPLCPTGQGRKERLKGKMSFANFKQIIDELGVYLYEVDLHNWGEPLLNEEIYKMIKYAHRHNIRVNLSTNLNFFDERKAEEIVKSGLDHLIVSLDGASQITYEKYRIGGKFNKIIKNIKMIVQKKKELKRLLPSITWQFIVMKHNEHEIPKAREMARRIGVNKFKLMSTFSDMGRELFWSKERRIRAVEKWLPHNKKYQLSIIKPCSFLWCQMVINWNGSVSPCCAVYPEEYDFGNIFNDGGFKKIWNNGKYRTARRIIRQRRIRGSEDMQNICAICFVNTA